MYYYSSRLLHGCCVKPPHSPRSAGGYPGVPLLPLPHHHHHPRTLYERVLSLALNAHKMRLFFNRYRLYEASRGEDERVRLIEERMRAYAESLGAAVAGGDASSSGRLGGTESG